MLFTQEIRKFIKLIFKWQYIWRIADIWWVVSLWIPIFSLLPISQKIDNIQQQLDTQDPQKVLMSYFSYIEQGKLDDAFNLFSQEKRYNHTYSGFVKWLDNFVAFEWLKITPIKEKDSAIQKVFLAEFWFKKRWLKAVDTKRWMYLTYNNNKREIKYTNTLYENWLKKWACEFYPLEQCK